MREFSVLMRMRWVLKEKGCQGDPPGPEEIPRLIRYLLHNRGLVEQSDVEQFLEPSLDDLHDPWLLPDLDRAVDRISSALSRGERILIFGDYDVDGISSAALLWRYLDRLGGRIRLRIPDRLTDSYGLSMKAVEEASAWEAGLIITVDSGTTAHAEVEHARSLGLDVIVVDHHQPESSLPPAVAVVNPWRADSSYPFPDLAAVGVVTKLVAGLSDRLGNGGRETPDPASLLDLTALGTVADNVSMEGENRIFVFHGLRRIRQQPRSGLKALIESARLDPHRIGSNDIAFQLGPRLNAAGRMGDTDTSLSLLINDDLTHCRSLASVLESHNRKRKQLLDDLIREATSLAEEEMALHPGEPLVMRSDDWHLGLLGIAAARIAERFDVPTILLSCEDALLRGSGRTARGCDLLGLLRQASEPLKSFGGHRAAIGLTLDDQEFPRFKDLFLEAARGSPGLCGMRERTLSVDAVARLDEVDSSLLDWLERMGPFGRGNREPLLAIKGHVAGQIRILKNNHIRFDVTSGGATRECIGFNLSGKARELGLKDGEVHIAVNAMWNRFRGEEKLQLSVRDIAVEDPFGIG